MEPLERGESAILHVSDLHYGCERAEVEAALLELHRRLRPELVIVSGDFTQRARLHEYERARDFLERLEPRALVAVPGNHDIPLLQPFERFSDPYARYARYVSEELEPEFDSPDWLVLGVNASSPLRIEDGAIPPATAERVERRLASAGADQLRLVVTHQPFLASRWQDRRRVMREPDALRRWSRVGLDLVLGGHNHVPFVRQLPDVPTFCVQAGTALSDRYRGGHVNSVNRLVRARGGGRGCRVERYDFDGQIFALVSSVDVTPSAL